MGSLEQGRQCFGIAVVAAAAAAVEESDTEVVAEELRTAVEAPGTRAVEGHRIADRVAAGCILPGVPGRLGSLVGRRLRRTV